MRKFDVFPDCGGIVTVKAAASDIAVEKARQFLKEYHNKTFSTCYVAEVHNEEVQE